MSLGSPFAIVLTLYAVGAFAPESRASQTNRERASDFIDHTIETLQDCDSQGKRSIWGAIQCARLDRALSESLRKSLREESWQWNELFEGLRDTSTREIHQIAQWRTLSANRFEITLPQIRFTVGCDKGECLIEAYEWPFVIPELYCTSPLPVIKNLRLSILKNRSYARVAEQRFEHSNLDPSRVSVRREWSHSSDKVHYVGESFDLEVEGPYTALNSPPPQQVRGLLRSLPIFGLGAPVECEWRNAP